MKIIKTMYISRNTSTVLIFSYTFHVSAASSPFIKSQNSAADAMSPPPPPSLSIFLKPKPTKPQPPPPSSSSPFLSIFLCREKKKKKSKMCPLRLILVFLSATLAGFFILRNLNSKPEILLQTSPTDEQVKPLDDSDSPIISRSTKVLSAIGSGFWTCVDMASGRYLWNHLSSSSGKKQSS